MRATSSPALTDWLTAVGTVGAVVVALLLAAWPAITRRWSRPKLKIETGTLEPFVRPVVVNRALTGDVRLRVGIRNVGRSSAYGVRAQLLRWWERDPGKQHGVDWLLLSSDPLLLKWVSIRPGDDRPGVQPEVTILKGATDYLDIALLDSNELKLLFDNNDDAVFDRGTSKRTGTWRIEFAFGGTNCHIKSETIEFSADDGHYFTASKLSSPPPEAHDVGLLHLLHELLDALHPDQDANGQ